MAKLSLEVLETTRRSSKKKSPLRLYKESQENKKTGSRTRGFFHLVTPLFREVLAELWKNCEKRRQLKREYHARDKEENKALNEADLVVS